MSALNLKMTAIFCVELSYEINLNFLFSEKILTELSLVDEYIFSKYLDLKGFVNFL